MQDSEKHKRTIRSFVRRAGRITVSQQRALDELWPAYGISYEPALLSFPDLFGRDAPIVLEIGFGNGETLVAQAAASPEHDFVGIEVHEPGIGHCLLQAEEAGIGNLRLINHDAIEVLKHQVPAASLTRLNLYFPDPWPKKRHHKRRLLQAPFVELAARRLAAGGVFHAATDWAPYAEQMLEVLEACPLLENSAGPGAYAPRPDYRPLTKFERRGVALGHAVFDLLYRRRASA